MKRIELRNRAKEVVAHVVVDDADYDWLNQWRWHRSSYGYAARSIWRDGKTHMVLMHRLILDLERGDRRQGDHINRNRLDNRRDNLRVVEAGQNIQNVTAYGRSAHRGVCWHKSKKKWMAYSRADGKIKFLGYHGDELAAARAASEFRREHMPFAVEDIAA